MPWDCFGTISANSAVATDRGNYPDLTGIAQMLGFDQRAKFHISGAASKKNTPFLMESLGANPKDFDRDKDQETRVAAWELDTVSRTLRSVWTDKDSQKRLSPSGWQLSGAVLENASFDGLDFTETDFSFGILSTRASRVLTLTEPP